MPLTIKLTDHSVPQGWILPDATAFNDGIMTKEMVERLNAATGSVTLGAAYVLGGGNAGTNNTFGNAGAGMTSSLNFNVRSGQLALELTDPGGEQTVVEVGTDASGNGLLRAYNSSEVAVISTEGGRLNFGAAYDSDPVALVASGDNVAVNLALGNVFSYTRAGATKLIQNPINPGDAQLVTLRITQSNPVGAISFGNQYRFPGGILPVLTPQVDVTDIFTFIRTNGLMYLIGQSQSYNSVYWNEVGPAGLVDFQGTWDNLGGGTANVAFYKDSLGRVHLTGAAAGGGGASIFTLPTFFTPPAQLNFPAVYDPQGSSSLGVIRIASSGLVALVAGAGTVAVSLDGISFLASQ